VAALTRYDSVIITAVKSFIKVSPKWVNSTKEQIYELMRNVTKLKGNKLAAV
jgi:hypothetical protein